MCRLLYAQNLQFYSGDYLQFNIGVDKSLMNDLDQHSETIRKAFEEHGKDIEQFIEEFDYENFYTSVANTFDKYGIKPPDGIMLSVGGSGFSPIILGAGVGVDAMFVANHGCAVY